MTLTFIIGVAALLIALATLRISRKNLRMADERFETARRLLNNSTEMLREAQAAAHELRVTRFHREDPILRPLRLLLVMMPDPDFEEVRGDDGSQFCAVATPRSYRAIGEADFVVAVWPQEGNAHAVKWRDPPPENIEVSPYEGSS